MIHVTTKIDRADPAVVNDLAAYSAAKGDRDGVVVVAREDAAEAAELCRAREEAEAGYIRRYPDGETPLTVSGLADVLRAKGLTTDEG